MVLGSEHFALDASAQGPVFAERTVKLYRAQVMEKMAARAVPDLVRAFEKLNVNDIERASVAIEQPGRPLVEAEAARSAVSRPEGAASSLPSLFARRWTSGSQWTDERPGGGARAEEGKAQRLAAALVVSVPQSCPPHR